MQIAIDNVRRKRDELRQDVHSHQALLSPVRKLPSDILQDIFLECLPKTQNAVMSIREAPLVLCCVCSSWRSVALSTPELWTSIHVAIPTPARRRGKLQPRHNAIQTWLRRSSARPLSISLAAIYPGSGASNPTKAEIRIFIDALVPFRHRWKSIMLRLPTYSLVDILAFSEFDVPLLETITIEPLYWTESPANYQPLGEGIEWTGFSFYHAPRLREISLSSVKTNPMALPLPSERLTHLCLEANTGWGGRLYSLSDSQAVKLLRRCPNLKSCTITITSSTYEVSQPVALPWLESLLVLQTASCATLNPFFKSLILPKLRAIGIQATDVNGAPPVTEPLTELLPHLTSSTESITLDGAPISEDFLIHILKRTPFLTTLRLGDPISGWGDSMPPFVTSKVLGHLTPTQTNIASCLCPNLEMLKLSGCKELSDDSIVEFICSRAKSPPTPSIAHLKRVTILFTRAPNIELDLPLRLNFMVTNLDLEISYPPWETMVVSETPWSGIQESEPWLSASTW